MSLNLPTKQTLRYLVPRKIKTIASKHTLNVLFINNRLWEFFINNTKWMVYKTILFPF